MSFDSLTLECFLAVTEAGSFTLAGQKVARTQSAISQQILKLENQIGKPLFVRGKTLSLTSAGEIMKGYATKILQLNHEAMDKFKQPELQGEVRFGIPDDFASVFLSDILTQFASLHPRITLNIECDLSLNLIDRFTQQEFDLVLVKIDNPSNIEYGTDVFSENLVWVANSKQLPDLDTKPLPLILSPKPCVYRARTINALDAISQKWRVVFSSESYAGKIAAVRAGIGLTVLPRMMIPKDLKILEDNLRLPKLADTHISLLKSNTQSIAVNAFEEFVLKKLSATHRH